MNLLFDLLNTVIQVFIMTYLPYYFLTTNREIDFNLGKKNLIISGVSIFILCILVTHIFDNGNVSNNLITIISIIIIVLVYKTSYKKALLSYLVSYTLVQLVAIVVTSIFWPLGNYILGGSNFDRILGIYIPAMAIEFMIIYYKDKIKLLYEYFTKSKKSLGIAILLVLSIDLIIFISIALNGWANIAITNMMILMVSIFTICVFVYINNIDKKYEEVRVLNELLINKNNELKKLKHDYGSEISYINGLYIMQQYDRLGIVLKDIINGNKEVSSGVKYINDRESIISSVAESLDLGDINLVIDEEFSSNLLGISEYELHKVISNLLSNAVTALKGYGLIVIKTYKIFNTVYISIKNNGPQIDPSVIDHIFEEGFTTKDNKDSENGYGLYIVKEIVENNNGKLYVKSNEKYTEFKIVFSNKNQ